MDVPLEKLGYTASISNIDEAVLVPLQDIVQEMGKATDPADAMPDEARLRPVVTTLAASSPALGMRLDGTLQGKTAYVDSRVVLNPLQGSASVPLGPQLLQTLKADVNVYLPKAITAEVNRRLEQSFGKDANGCNLDCQLRHQGIAREQADAHAGAQAPLHPFVPHGVPGAAARRAPVSHCSHSSGVSGSVS